MPCPRGQEGKHMLYRNAMKGAGHDGEGYRTLLAQLQ